MLIVDDEKMFLFFVKKVLEGGGLTVDISDNLKGALKLIGENDYVVVIADIRLTGSDGEEGVEILRQVRDVSPRTKVIIITADGSQSFRTRAYSSGAYLFFEKPVPTSLLKGAINGCMEEHDGVVRI